MTCHDGINLHDILWCLDNNAPCILVKMHTFAFFLARAVGSLRTVYIQEVFTHNLVFLNTSYITIFLFFVSETVWFKFELNKP